MSIQSLSLLATVSAVALLSACGAMSPMTSMKPMAIYSQDALPDAVKVPAGNKVAMETVGVGEITYECRDKANAPGMTEWVFVGPKAVLNDRSGKQVGTYYGPPAIWKSMDGSKLTATQLAVAPSGAGNLPYQLVKANPAMGAGMMSGVAPSTTCSAANKGSKEIVQYQTDRADPVHRPGREGDLRAGAGVAVSGLTLSVK